MNGVTRNGGVGEWVSGRMGGYATESIPVSAHRVEPFSHSPTLPFSQTPHTPTLSS